MKNEIQFETFVTRESLLAAWKKFSAGKWRTQSVRDFDPALYDQLCSYAGMGIVADGEMFIRV